MTVQNSQYRFSTEFLSPMPMCQSLPDGEGPSTRYIADRALLQAGIMLNNAAAQAHRLFDPMDRLEDYDDIFSVLPAPDCVRTWQSDLMFAEQRLSGMHPNMLEAVDGIPDVFDSGVVTESIEALFGKQTPQLFWCNWARYLEGLPNGGWEGGTKRIAPSAALFGWRHTEHADRGELVPVAVAVDVRSKASTATPLSGRYAWLAARTYAQVADTTVHEMRSHLYGAHFFQEAIAVATGRYLSMDHPVHRLLRPHLKFLLFNNDLGKQVLVNPGGSVDQLLAGTLAGSLDIVRQAWGEHDFTRHAFDQDLSERGVADTTRLPHYPYRDDGLDLWAVIGGFTGAFVSTVYREESDLGVDKELEAWWNCLSPTDAGAWDGRSESGLQGVPAQRNRKNLAFILQRILFTAGPYHSAVNYPQYEYLAYCPNQPGAAYAAFSHELASEADLLRILPPYQQVMKQLEVARQLAGYRYDRFAEYENEDLLAIPGMDELARSFRGALDAVERRIDDRNRRRRLPYPYLKPSLITNSTSV